MKSGGLRKYIKLKIKKCFCMFKGIGSSRDGAYVSISTDLKNPRCIVLGEGAVLEKRARLYANGKNSRVEIGDYTTILPFALLKANGGTIKLGKRCTVNDYVVLNGLGGINIGDDVHIASHVAIVASEHRIEKLGTPYFSKDMQGQGIKIENSVWIGANAVILDGVTIGAMSVIGAGAVVTKDIPPHSLAVGVPARVIKQLG